MLLQHFSTRITCTLTVPECDVNQRHIVSYRRRQSSAKLGGRGGWEDGVFLVPFSFVIFYIFSLTLKSGFLSHLHRVPSALTARFVEDEVI